MVAIPDTFDMGKAERPTVVATSAELANVGMAVEKAMQKLHEEQKAAAAPEKIEIPEFVVKSAEPKVAEGAVPPDIEFASIIHSAPENIAEKPPVDYRKGFSKQTFDTREARRSEMFKNGARAIDELAAEFALNDRLTTKPGHLTPAQIQDLKLSATNAM